MIAENKIVELDVPRAELRDPNLVMRLNRMGSFHQTRLSFMRGLLRRLKSENWIFTRPVWRMDEKGVGVAVYSAKGPQRTYSLICFSHDLDPAKRSDRSIATEWDATFTMFDGEPTEKDIERLSHQVPKQEAGRVSSTELSISRANRSVRLFEHVVERLASGRQPDLEKIEAVGYLMRTTAVYGSGKFGAASHDTIANRQECKRPFQIEMLSVFLTRAFTVDIVEHVAKAQSPQTAVQMEPSLRRRLGVGNSTGLGMAPFLVSHPVLINNWIAAREEALARVRGLPKAYDNRIANFDVNLSRAQSGIGSWITSHEAQAARVSVLQNDLRELRGYFEIDQLTCHRPWDDLYRWGTKNLSIEGQELLVSLIIEPYGDLIDDLADSMSADERADFSIDGSVSVDTFKQVLIDVYGWAFDIDNTQPENHARYWYVSENKLEPRLGERADAPDAEHYEIPLSVGRDVAAMARDIDAHEQTQSLAHFLLHHPEHRHIARRVQITARYPYAEIRDNLLAAKLAPIDMLRCKLSFFGATNFDPRSDRWVRITMFQNAPYPHELESASEDDWIYPAMEEVQ